MYSTERDISIKRVYGKKEFFCRWRYAESYRRKYTGVTMKAHFRLAGMGNIFSALTLAPSKKNGTCPALHVLHAFDVLL